MSQNLASNQPRLAEPRDTIADQRQTDLEEFLRRVNARPAPISAAEAREREWRSAVGYLLECLSLAGTYTPSHQHADQQSAIGQARRLMDFDERPAPPALDTALDALYGLVEVFPDPCRSEHQSAMDAAIAVLDDDRASRASRRTAA